ncbi:hypothetical protein FRC08_002592 [Ceratobasidium sp. 394]|nr:hypothetical protein FRC08_002592 [Ceratobasidium sp. 394]
MFRDDPQPMEDSKLTEAVDELEEILLKIRKRVIEWANLNRIKSLMRQGQIASDIGTFHQTLDTHVIKFQIISSIDLNRQHRRLDLCRQNDQEEGKEMFVQIPVATRRLPFKLISLRFRAFVRNVEDL